MISGPVLEMIARNSKFAQTYQRPPGLLQMAEKIKAAGSGVTVLSCSDPRLFPEEILGLDPTLKATMVRNAGGRAFDAIRTLAVLQTIASPGTIVVMHHTDCGLSHFHDHTIRNALLEIAPSQEKTLATMKFGQIADSIEDTVREDLAILQNSLLIKKGTQFIGLKFETETGKLSIVEL